MKIDTDIVSAKSSFVEEFAKSDFEFTSEAGNFAAMLQTGVKLAQEGNRAEARHLLLRVAEAEPQNETAWLWLASISEYPEELLIFLQNVLKINPQNERAIEWEQATKSLLAKTFVQRGIEACQENRPDFGKQCFLYALGQDQNSEMAWLWLASITESVEEKIIHLHKVLSLNPNNEAAQSSLKSLKDQKIQSLLRKANSAAIAGEHETARILLEDVMNESPDVEEAWILKAYLATDFFEKIKYYEQVLQINPANEAAQAGMSSLKVLMEKSETEPDSFDKFDSHGNEIDEISPRNDFSEYQETPSAETLTNESALENPAENLVETPAEFTENQPNDDFFSENHTFESDTPAQSADPVYFEEFSDFAQNPATSNPTDEPTASSEDYLTDDTQTPNSEDYLIDDTQIPNLETSVTETLPAHETSFSPVENDFSDQTNFFYSENSNHEFTETAAQETKTDAADENDFEILETNSDEYDAPTEKEEIEFSLDSEDSESFVIADENVPSLEQYNFSEDKTEIEVNEFSEISTTTDEFSHEQVNDSETENRFDDGFSANVNDDFSANNETEQAVEDSHDSEKPSETRSIYEMSATENYFADYNQPTVEFSYTETNLDNNEYLENSEEVAAESFSQDLGNDNPLMETAENVAFESLPEKENAPVFAAETTELTDTELPNYFATSANEETADFAAPQSEMTMAEDVAECPYCGFGNNPHTVVCASCRTILSLADLEMLLAYQDADNLLLEKAIERIELQKTARDLTASELQALGIAHLNAKNLRKGFNSLQEASKLAPNDVVLGSKVNFLAIRLSEIELQESKNQESFPVSRTIMVVDDSPTVRKLISGKLEKSGHFVVTAVDGVDAMTKIAETIPDLVLLDIAMPQMDGYQVCKLIRNNEATKDVPVVMISGKDGFFDKVRGKMVGSTGYITKPFGPETLMKAVENYIN